MSARKRVLILWNQTEEDIYERWRQEGPKKLEWDPNRTAPDVGTVQEEMDHFVKALVEAGFHVDIVNVEDDLARIIGAVELYRPDAVFNLIEFFNEEAIQETYIAGLYELLGVPFTGNRAVTLANCQNKYRTKVILSAAGVATSPFMICPPKQPISLEKASALRFPLIVKPAMEDASGGIEPDSVVHDLDALKARVEKVTAEYEMPALVEEYIEGREIHAAILGNGPNAEVLPLFEMEFDDSKFNPDGEWRPQMITFRAKWDPHSKDFYSMDAVCPAVNLEPEVEERIRQTALAAYRTMGCRDYARIDMRVRDGQPYILEVNPNPDLVDETAYVMCATASGRSYPETLRDIVNLAIGRGEEWEKAESQAVLPTDQLLKEWHLSRRGISDDGLPPPGTPGWDGSPPAEPVQGQLQPGQAIPDAPESQSVTVSTWPPPAEAAERCPTCGQEMPHSGQVAPAPTDPAQPT